MSATDQPIFWRLPDVTNRLGLCESSIRRLRKTDPDFPSPVQLTKRAIAWRRDEVEAWAEAREQVDEARSGG